MPETYGNIHICKKASKAVKKTHTDQPLGGGGGKQATLGLWRTNGPKFPLDPPAIRYKYIPRQCTVFLSETGAPKKQYLLNQWTNIAVIGLIRKS